MERLCLALRVGLHMVRNSSEISILSPFIQLKFISVPIFMGTIISVNVQNKSAYTMNHHSSYNIFCRILCNLLLNMFYKYEERNQLLHAYI